MLTALDETLHHQGRLTFQHVLTKRHVARERGFFFPVFVGRPV
ncbi:hypothetical protein [Massilia cavernae]|nr:hypothetical protein [Massilia cavernae]